jgi:hypothetical protein
MRVTGPPTVSESLRRRVETVGWASESSSAARVTLPRRIVASKAMSCGRKPWRKKRRSRARGMKEPLSLEVAKVSLTTIVSIAADHAGARLRPD